MTRRLRLDPEVEGLLQEIARQPKSHLLRVERPDDLTPLEDREPVRGTEPFLTKVERHLVETQREEVARLLADLALVLRREDPRRHKSNTAYQAGDRTAGRSRNHLEDEGARLGRTVDDPEAKRALELALGVSRGPGLTSASPITLLNASLGLVPTHRARLLVAHDLTDTGQLRSAEAITRRVLMSRPDPMLSTLAREHLGRIQYERGEHEDSLRSYSVAAHRAPTLFLPGAAWFSVSLLVANRAEAEAAARHVAAAIPTDHPFVDWYADLLRRERRSGRWSPTAGSGRLLETAADTAHSPVRRMCHALS